MAKFKAKPWKTGTSHVITIPAIFIENNTIPKDKETTFTTEEEKEEEQ